VVLSRTPDLGYDFESNSGRVFNYFSCGVACSEVEVDCLTGAHKVRTVSPEGQDQDMRTNTCSVP